MKIANLAHSMGPSSEPGGSMTYIAIYLGLSLAYLEAALESFGERKRRSGLRETCIACLYCAAALVALFAGPGEFHS
jgi:hypothetical protein